MPRIIRIILYICIIALLLGAILYLLFGKKSVIIETVTPERKTIQETTKVTGSVLSTSQVAISFDVSGVVQKIHVKEGDVVKTGTVLASLSDIEYERKVKEARENLFREEVILSKKNTELLNSKNNSTLAETGVLENKIKQEKVFIMSLQESLNEALLSQLKTKSIAPFDGVVTSISFNKGDSVQAHKQAISMISSNVFQIEAKVGETDITKVKVGNKVDVTFDAYGDKVIFPALVIRVNTEKEKIKDVSTYTVIINFYTDDTRIKSDMKAHVVIHTYTKEAALTLPSHFVRVLSPKKGEVSIVEKQGIHTKEIDIGVFGDASDVEILGGLEVDDLVQATRSGAKKK